jgi:hypothetical protein
VYNSSRRAAELVRPPGGVRPPVPPETSLMLCPCDRSTRRLDSRANLGQSSSNDRLTTRSLAFAVLTPSSGSELPVWYGLTGAGFSHLAESVPPQSNTPLRPAHDFLTQLHLLSEYFSCLQLLPTLHSVTLHRPVCGLQVAVNECDPICSGCEWVNCSDRVCLLHPRDARLTQAA